MQPTAVTVLSTAYVEHEIHMSVTTNETRGSDGQALLGRWPCTSRV